MGHRSAAWIAEEEAVVKGVWDGKPGAFVEVVQACGFGEVCSDCGHGVGVADGWW